MLFPAGEERTDGRRWNHTHMRERKKERKKEYYVGEVGNVSALLLL